MILFQNLYIFKKGKWRKAILDALNHSTFVESGKHILNNRGYYKLKNEKKDDNENSFQNDNSNQIQNSNENIIYFNNQIEYYQYLTSIHFELQENMLNLRQEINNSIELLKVLQSKMIKFDEKEEINLIIQSKEMSLQSIDTFIF